jgi:hypothetical protein
MANLVDVICWLSFCAPCSIGISSIRGLISIPYTSIDGRFRTFFFVRNTACQARAWRLELEPLPIHR